MAIVAAGEPAPDFTLKTADGEDFTREQLWDAIRLYASRSRRFGGAVDAPKP